MPTGLTPSPGSASRIWPTEPRPGRPPHFSKLLFFVGEIGARFRTDSWRPPIASLGVGTWLRQELDDQAIFRGRSQNRLARSAPGLPATDLRRRPGVCAAQSRRCCMPTTTVRAFWNRPPPGVGCHRRSTSSAQNAPARMIGPYKLLQQIGEGGFGVVFMAEQTAAGPPQGRAQGHQAGHGHAAGDRPLRGRAAGAGADGPSRTSPRCSTAAPPTRGRPYFVMELVRGVPITEYCDENQPDAARSGWSCSCRSARRCSTPTRRGSSTATSSRRMCWSRVHDGEPVAKVIDFGVAKATGPAADREDAVHRLRARWSARRCT